MNVTETLVDGLKRQFQVTVPAQNINWAINQRLIELTKTMKVAGFRAGKVPLQLVRQRYGNSVVNEVINAVVINSSHEALASKNLRAAILPTFDGVEIKKTGELEFKMNLEILPEITLGDFGALALNREQCSVSDSALEEAITVLAARNRDYEKSAAGYAAKLGDLVVIDFVGYKGDKTFEGGTAKDFKLVLGSKQFIDGFEDQLVGVKSGDQLDITVKFPDQYPSKDLAGHKAKFAITVHQVQIAVAPKLDDEFAQRLGYKTIGDLRERVKKQIESEYKQQSWMKLKRQLMDQLSSQYSFELPSTMVEQEFQTIWSQLQTAEANGEFDPSFEGKDEDYKKAQYRDIAARRVRLGLILAEVGKQNNLTVTQAEFDSALMSEVRQYPGQEKKAFDFFRTDKEAQDRLRAPILEDKAVNFIIELARVSDKPVTVDELFAEPEEAGKITSGGVVKKPRKTKKVSE